MNCDNCNKPYTVEHILDTDIDDLATIPDYFIGVRTIENPSTGVVIATPVRVPGARVMPTGNLANVIAITTNNATLEIPDNQVRGGYIDIQPGGNIVRLADSTHPAMFLMVGNYTDTKMLIQTTGFLNIPAGHNYIVGTQYYLDEVGSPTTDSTTTGQKLFMPMDDYTLNVNGDF